MYRRALIRLSIACATLMASMIVVSLTESAQVQQVVPPLYNPYPPGILPADLVPEIARVRLEVQGIFDQALKEWLALPPPTVTGQPPTLTGTGYDAVRILGKLMNFDENMSPFRNRACAF